MKYVGCWVSDQDEAVAFYTEKLGFEVREDVTFGEGDSYRWLIVGPPGDAGPGLILSRPGPPAMDEETGKQVLDLVAKGARAAGSSSRSSPRSASTGSTPRSGTPRGTSGGSCSRPSTTRRR